MLASIIKLIFIIIVVCTFPLTAQYEDNSHTMAFSRTMHYALSKNDKGNYQLKSEIKTKIRYLSERALKNNTFYVTEEFSAKVNKLNGSYIKKEGFGAPQIGFYYAKPEDVFIGNYKIHSITFDKPLKVKDSIQYSYQETFTEAAYMPLIEVPNVDYLEYLQIKIDHPRDTYVDFEIRYTTDTLDCRIDRQSEKTTLTFRNINYRTPLAHNPFERIRAVILTKLQNAKREPINPYTPASFTSWYNGKLAQNGLIDDRHDSLAQAITRGLEEPMDKLRAIHNHVKNRIRYIAVADSFHAIIPHRSKKVLELNYGDCKDRALLLMLLARSAGIPVRMALVSTTPRLRFDGVHTSFFNHVINVYEADGKRFYFDPTAKYCEFGNLPPTDFNGRVLILNEANPVYTDEPPLPRKLSIEVEVNGEMDSLRAAKASIKLRNEYLSSARHARYELSGQALENYLSRMINSNFSKISLDQFHFESETDSSMTFSAKADLSEFIIQTATRKYIPQAPFQSVSSQTGERIKDTWPVYMKNPELLGMILRLKIGDAKVNYKDIALGDKGVAWFSNQTSLDASRGMLETRYEFVQQSLWYDGAERMSYLEFCKQYLKLKTSLITITGNTP